MPPRPAAGRARSAAEATRLGASVAHLHDSAAAADKRGDGHPISYILSYATLVHNPRIKHFCRQIAKAATEAHAEIVTIDGLATLPGPTRPRRRRPGACGGARARAGESRDQSIERDWDVMAAQTAGGCLRIRKLQTQL